MSSNEAFWNHSSFAFVANSAQKRFPDLSYRELKRRGKAVFAVDPSVWKVQGDTTYPDLTALPESVDAVIIESPREDTAEWVRRAADAGIRNVWIHRNRDTPEAIQVAEDRGLDVHVGACAAMYLLRGPSVHALHKWVCKARGTY